MIFSQFLFLFNFTDSRKKIKFFILNFLLLGSIYLLMMYPFLIKSLSFNNLWISQVKLSFFIDLFFPRFFGSKIMGYLYLISLIFLIIKFYKLILSKKSLYQLLFILLISAYILPLIYGLIKIPILIDRYIIFIITPIILLISIFIYKQTTKLKWFFIIIVCSFTFVNNYIEIFERKNAKPEFNTVLSEISKIQKNKIEIVTDNKYNHEYITNYLEKIKFSKFEDFDYFEYNMPINDQFFWSICYLPINGFNCEKNLIHTNYKKKITKNFYLIEAILFEKKN